MRFPLTAYPGMNRFVLDWLDCLPAALRFLPRADGAPAARPRGGAVSPELVAALETSNRKWSSFVGGELRRWAAGETATLIAGQQAGFAGGPLYTLAKIASLVKMKRELAARGVPATIFFWLATEDHDYAEAATLQVPASSVASSKSGVNRQLDLVTLRARSAVDSRRMVGPSPVPDSLRRQLLALYDMEQPSWLREGVTFGDSFAELCAAVVDEKIVFVDSLLPELRRAGAPLFERMQTMRGAMQQEIASRSDGLAQAGYAPQILARPGEPYTLLFRVDEGGERHILEENALAVDATRISTSVLTRPLLQDFVFQPDVFVGGPSEVAYYAQIAPLHALLGVPMPGIALRGHALVAPKRVVRLFERFVLGPEEIFTSADAIVIEREAPAVAEIEKIAVAARAGLARQMTRIGELALPAEHSLARALNRSIGHIEYHFEKLTERAVRGLVRKDRERHAALRELVATLYPDRHVQERVVGWFAYWRQYGNHLVDRLVEEIEPDSNTFKVVAL